jgi:hypothetical protein
MQMRVQMQGRCSLLLLLLLLLLQKKKKIIVGRRKRDSRAVVCPAPDGNSAARQVQVLDEKSSGGRGVCQVFSRAIVVILLAQASA